MHRRHWLLGVLALSACSFTQVKDVTYLGPAQPTKPSDCQVSIVRGPAPGPVVNVATLRVSGTEEARCLERIRKEACALGGDLVYGVHDAPRNVDEGVLIGVDLIGTVARRGP